MPSEKSPPAFDALHVPPGALELGGFEVIRAVVVEGALHVALRRAFDDPEAWGMVIADITRHVARIYEDRFPEDGTVERIRALFNPEIDSPTSPVNVSALS